jgi:hypothetical protein
VQIYPIIPQRLDTLARPTFLGVTLGGLEITGMIQGSILYASGEDVSQDNSNLFWDDINKRLGIGTNSPQNQLHIMAAVGEDPCIIESTIDTKSPSTITKNDLGNRLFFGMKGSNTGALSNKGFITTIDSEQSGGEETTLARIEVGHDGSADDEKGYKDWFVNAGSDGNSPTFAMRLNSIGLGVGTKTQVSLLEADGALGLAIETVTGNTTLNATHSTLLVNASGNVTITLPAAASVYNSTDDVGRIYTIKKIDTDANRVVIDGNGSETIDGAATAVITTQYESVTIQSDGSNWHIL